MLIAPPSYRFNAADTTKDLLILLHSDLFNINQLFILLYCSHKFLRQWVFIYWRKADVVIKSIGFFKAS